MLLTNSEDNEVICPIELKSTLPEPFSSTIEQQDALEFGRIFLENIENLLKETKDSKLKVIIYLMINVKYLDFSG